MLFPFPTAPRFIAGGLIIDFTLDTAALEAPAFLRAGTIINPYHPALVIMSDGAFRRTWNPAHLGMVALVLGHGLAASHNLSAFGAAILWAMLREKRYLEAEFGDDCRVLLRPAHQGSNPDGGPVDSGRAWG